MECTSDIVYCSPSTSNFSNITDTQCLTYSTNQSGYIKYESKKKTSSRIKWNPGLIQEHDSDFSPPLINVTSWQDLSLKTICISYIVNNFSSVDSLVGFPEIVGKELFNACLKAGNLHSCQSTNWLKAMNIFLQAYGQTVLRTLSLSGKGKFLAACMDDIFPYLHLVEVDFSSCGIGDQHEVLMHIGKLQMLQNLNLSNNNLSEEGVKHLTCSFRRSHKGLESLNVLKLNRNKTMKNYFLLNLEPLPKLNAIVVDHSSIGLLMQYLKRYPTSKFNVCPHGTSIHKDMLDESEISTQGWAACLIDQNVKNFEINFCKKNVPDQKTKSISSFYGKSKFISSDSTMHDNNQHNKENNISLVICNCLHVLSSNQKYVATVNRRRSELKRHSNSKPINQPASKLVRPFFIDPYMLSLYSS